MGMRTMRVYNLHGALLNSIETKSGYRQRDIEMTGSGDLFYADYTDRTVNTIQNAHTQEVISLYIGDLLVYVVTPLKTSWLSWTLMIKKQKLCATLALQSNKLFRIMQSLSIQLMEYLAL